MSYLLTDLLLRALGLRILSASARVARLTLLCMGALFLVTPLITDSLRPRSDLVEDEALRPLIFRLGRKLVLPRRLKPRFAPDPNGFKGSKCSGILDHSKDKESFCLT